MIAPDTASPCTGICAVEAHTGWCAGCQRTLAEIAAWAGLDEPARRSIMAKIVDRRAGLRDCRATLRRS
ncbi:MAG: DUF1289 domain-containing protein [Betaproteobacteria bacterium]|nr:DUF1289 domain-containing protein [Betaproteobacteria bacterium]